jgi:HTH-type transcriptional regulator/antitoxin HipB
VLLDRLGLAAEIAVEPNRIPITVWLEMAKRWSGTLGADQESDRFVQDQRYRNVLGGKPPKMLSGEKAPKTSLGGKAHKKPIDATEKRTTMQAIARTPLQLGNSIRQRRRELGLTQEQLAAKTGVRQRTISDIERSATARIDTVLRALAALDLELVVRPRTKGSSQDIEKLF